ncbi:MAG: PAS domain S-box protein [Cyclobacteriaceae bacterium]|nr:PAS domain S-box protein [Cyclobacteriaceae bacterium]MCH8517116.1 PAS domain S-box protein [Cyclobacteriaceae bacterium]
MIKKVAIGTKITVIVLLVVIMTIVSISFISYNFNIRKSQDHAVKSLSLIADLKSEKIATYLANDKKQLEIISSEEGLDDKIFTFKNTYIQNEDSAINLYAPLIETKFEKLKSQYHFENIYLISSQGELLITTDTDPVLQQDLLNQIKKGIGQLSDKSIFLSLPYEKRSKLFYSGIVKKSQMGEAVFLVFEMDFSTVENFVTDTTSLAETGEIILTTLIDDKVVFINNPRLSPIGTRISQGISIGEEEGKSFQNSIKSGSYGSIEDTDYRLKEVIASYRQIPDTNFGVVVKQDTDELKSAIQSVLSQYVVVGLIILLLALGTSLLFSKFLIRSLISLKETVELLGKGVLPEKVERISRDEVGDIAQSMNDLVQGLKRTANFTHQIGQGNFKAKFEPMSNQDTLGQALLTMRTSLQDTEKRDKERNWIVKGVADIGEILRRHQNLGEMGDEIISFTTETINAIQGALYVTENLDNVDNYKNLHLDLVSSYAYHKKKYLKAKFRFAEGLVGQAAVEKDTILRTEVPHDYVSITSGLLGDKRPTCLLFVPLITNERVYGVLEFAGLEKFSDSQIKFVEEISVIVARTVFNIQVNEQTRKLLAESQQMSGELKEQQQVLEQNAIEMAATQEELKRTNQQLEDQIEEVNRTQKRMQLLLENASEVITIYEQDRSIRYISPSVERILGFSQEELIGKNDISNVKEEFRELISNAFDEIAATPFAQITEQCLYTTASGGEIWVEITGTNLLTDAAIKGIICNIRDITERKRAEQEERMKSKMQSLSENSPDLITRLDLEGNVFYINPMIATYQGKQPDDVRNKNIEDLDIEPTIITEWRNILEQVKISNSKVSHEMDFPSLIGERVMQVNAIPELDEGENLESVLVISHDITDRKQTELEIQSKNKKISDSINYAYRIQGAILPDNKLIRRDLPESFILYKAKDVVSGDFPWYIKVGDNIFIAAVDCTGHGVPGALLSLIGYFLLNDIVRSRKIDDPGLILDELDRGVTSTLRQDEDDSKTKDGMDIALCKINLKNKELEFSGAHRPLYYLHKNGELEETKGNKFAIGGGIYKNQTHFTNHRYKFEKGDSIFFCSDGFPDQFGGPDNRKYGPKRTRKLIEDHHNKSMEEMYSIMDKTWEDWKGDYKQTDDVLMIGIKF